MTRQGIVSEVLSDRMGLLSDIPGCDQAHEIPASISPSLLTAVEEALLRGDTHYTVRAGVPELRRRVSGELARMGGPAYDSIDSVLITCGEAESLFVALLGLRPEPGVVLAVSSQPCRHEALFKLAGLRVLSPDKAAVREQPAVLIYREWQGDRSRQETLLQRAIGDDLPDILNLGSAVGTARDLQLPPSAADRTLFLGSFDSLPGLASFRLGFLAGPKALVDRIAVWKQALSICSAAPSQRAALVALTEWQGKEP